MRIVTTFLLSALYFSKVFSTGIPFSRAPEFMNIDENFDPCITQTTDTWMCYQGNSFRCETVDTNNGERGNTYEWLDCSRHLLACAGGRCDFSTNICKNGATYRASECACVSSWIGVACDICGLDATTCSSGRINEEKCECACDNKCVNGGILYGDCFCTCPSYCKNGGSRNGDCSCTCKGNWIDDLCETCSLNDSDCGPGGSVDENCQCVCGIECNEETTIDQTETCECNCLGGWTGQECKDCFIGPDNCMNNTVYNEEKCACECQTECLWANTESYGSNCTCSCKGNWEGEFCEECSLKAEDAPKDYGLILSKCVYTCNLPCKNAVGISNNSCTCSCEKGWRGKLCDEKIPEQSNEAFPFWAPYVIGGGSLIIAIALIWCVCHGRAETNVDGEGESDWKQRNRNWG